MSATFSPDERGEESILIFIHSVALLRTDSMRRLISYAEFKCGLTCSNTLAQPGCSNEREGHHALRDEDDKDEHGPGRRCVVHDLAGVREVIETLPRNHADSLSESHEYPACFTGEGGQRGRRHCRSQLRQKSEKPVQRERTLYRRLSRINSIIDRRDLNMRR